jgi:hypothetical protein
MVVVVVYFFMSESGNFWIHARILIKNDATKLTTCISVLQRKCLYFVGCFCLLPEVKT